MKPIAKNILRRRLRPLLEFPRPPELVVPFPSLSSEWTKNYPTLIKPWFDGVRAFWLPDEQLFQLESGELIQVTGIVPKSNYIEPLEGVFFEKEKTEVEIRQMLIEDRPSDQLNFNIVDLAREDDAYSRAQYCQNIPQQQDGHVYIAQMVQVNTADGFNTWLAQWQGALFSGALAVDYMAPWLAPEYTVIDPV